MNEGEASSTALGAALMRAAHLVIDGEPKVFVDEYAIEFLDDGRRLGMAGNPTLSQRHVRASRAHILGRSAFTEAELVQAVRDGCRQYVVLGAGYDSSPARLRDVLRDCVTFEVDHPATQMLKRARAADLSWPDNVRFVSVDFERDALAERLVAAGWRPDLSTFWSWLGVTMYLSDDAVMATLGFIARGAPGTTIVMNYTVHDDECDPADLVLRDTGARGVAKQGESWINFYRPAELADRVRALGFSSVRTVLPAEFAERYFAGRNDGLWWSSLTAALVARV